MNFKCLLGLVLALCWAVPVSAVEKSIYKSDFDRGVGREYWSGTKSFATPLDGERLLGPFVSDESTTLSLKALPAHKLVRLRCRVYMLDTVDGSHTGDQDAWSVGIVGGPCLLHTTFDNKWSVHLWKVVDGDPERAQAYPNEVAAARHPSRLGADALNALGLDAKVDQDPVDLAIGYDLDLIFPHDGKDLALRFGGTFMNQSTESWGLDEVQVSVLDAPVADEIELVEHWQVMHGGDPEKANSALWAILAQGKAGIDFALDRVGEGAAEQGKLAKQRREKLAKDYASAVSDLTSDQFIERVEATQALLKMGTSIRPLLEKQLRGKVDPQAKVLLKSILKKFGDVPAAGEAPSLEAMARSRVKHLLRVANTPETKAALAEMLAVDQDTGLAHDEVVLAAEDAKLKGPGWGFELDAERGCWTNWYLVSNALYWFPALPAGEFEVVLDLATGDGVGGDEFEVLVAGQVLEGKVPQLEDGAEDEFREVSVGKVLVTNSGKEVIYVRSKGSRGPWLMDLKKMRLVPVE